MIMGHVPIMPKKAARMRLQGICGLGRQSVRGLFSCVKKPAC